jgi:hypothetical protein
MTLIHMAAVWQHSRSSGTARLVMLAIADLSDRSGEVTVPQSEIATMINADTSTVARAVESLVVARELRIVEPATGTRAARYAICDPSCGIEALIMIPAGQPASPEISEPDRAVIGAPEAKTVPAGEGPEAEAHQIAPQQEAAVAGAVLPLPPPGYPQNDVGRVIHALGVQIDPAEPLAWHRASYAEPLATAINATGLPLPAVLAAIRATRRQAVPHHMGDVIRAIREAVQI